MDNRDWIVAQVSSEEARRWDGPNGTVWYKKAKLEGHERPVSIGKKAPDALKVGDSVYGRIENDPSGSEDKFKAGKKPFGGGAQASFGGTSGSYNTPQKPAYKDNSDGMRQGMCFNNAANYVNLVYAPEGKNKATAEVWAKTVHEYANALYKLGDLGKDGGSEDTTLKAPATTSNPARLKKGDAVWPSDKPGADPEWESLFVAGAEADEIPLSEIPF